MTAGSWAPRPSAGRAWNGASTSSPWRSRKTGRCSTWKRRSFATRPQFGCAKDPLNMAGMIAANGIRGDARIAHWEDLERTPPLMLDVRDASAVRKGSVPGAAHIPLDELRARMDELPRERDIWAYCFAGQRSYCAARALLQHGFRIRSVSGGYKTYLQFRPPAPGEAGKANERCPRSRWAKTEARAERRRLRKDKDQRDQVRPRLTISRRPCMANRHAPVVARWVSRPDQGRWRQRSLRPGGLSG